MPATAKRKKSPSKTSVARRPGKHGGSLQTGNPGNKGGSGRPPSVIRDQLRGSYDERMTFLDRVIDGEVMQKAKVPLVAVLPHVLCPNCGEGGQEPRDGLLALMDVTFEATVSASVKDRIAALEHQAKYGLGALKEISVENVRERVAGTLAVIRSHCTADQSTAIIAALRPVWA